MDDSDGGTEDRPPGYDALCEQRIPESTIEDWHEKGYDLRQMSLALATYRDSGETLLSNGRLAKGELGEIRAELEFASEYPRLEGCECVVDFKLNNVRPAIERKRHLQPSL